MSFYIHNGEKVTGNENDAFTKSFMQIPEGTKAIARINKFEVISKEASQYGDAQKYIQLTYKLLDGDFKGREVQQKIKCFDGKDDQIKRAKNMLVLIMKLCNFTPTHTDEPTTAELSKMCSNIAGIMIGEWSMVKNDNSGIMEGNFVREVHVSNGFECETGIKAETPHITQSSPDSAFSRNKALNEDKTDLLFGDDVPF